MVKQQKTKEAENRRKNAINNNVKPSVKEKWNKIKSKVEEKWNKIKNSWAVAFLILVIYGGIVFALYSGEKEEPLWYIRLSLALLMVGPISGFANVVARSNFIDNAKKCWEVIIFNVLIEFPVWIATFIAFRAFLDKIHHYNQSGYDLLSDICIVVFCMVCLFGKISFSICSDWNKVKANLKGDSNVISSTGSSEGEKGSKPV